MLNEKLLHYVWQFQQYDITQLVTTQQQKILIIEPGKPNEDGGPDFVEAIIQINETKWYGHVEIHNKSSEWYQHGHQNDAAYQNVILHIVLEENRPVYYTNGERIPCVELSQRINPRTIKVFKRLYQKPLSIPCQGLLSTVPDLTKRWWLDRVVVERMVVRQQKVESILSIYKGDWEASFFHLLAGGFGLRVNQAAFEDVALRTKRSILLRHRDQLFQLEALLFGQANMLSSDFKDDYPTTLADTYRYLAIKYQLEPIPGFPWKFSRMRPASFPTLRLAQLAMLLHRSDHLFSKFLVAETMEEMVHMLDVTVSGYWVNHHRFDTLSNPSQKRLGKQAISQIIINVLVPILMFYGQVRGKPILRQRAISILESVQPENNNIIRKWSSLGWKAQNSWDSQGLIQLKKSYCTKHKCLQCGIGQYVMRS